MHEIGFDNPWLKAVEAARRRVPAWAAAVIATVLATGLVWAGSKAAGLAVRAADPAIFRGLGGKIGLQAAFYAAAFGPLWLCVWAIKRFWEVRPGLVGGWPALGGLALGLPLGTGGFAAVAGVAALAGAVMHGASSAVGAAAAVGVAASVLIFAFQAGAEEYVFRGWLQPLLCARWGAWVGLISTAVIFAAVHLVGGARSPLTLVNLLLAGLLFGLLALRTGGLWAPLAAHWGWNWMEASGLGLEPDPGVGPLGALADFDLRGRALWSGGADHLNGSLAETLVLLGLTGLFVVWGRKLRPAAAPSSSA